MKKTETTLPENDIRFAWMNALHVRQIINALNFVDQNAARFVGGCVRDSLLGSEPNDIDIATKLTPDEVNSALSNAGLRSAPTGIDHGTITAIADHVGVEVTTLRSDVSTDGRRATVSFTTDWEIDAGRRDFTVNALYASADGRLFDYYEGLDDLYAKKIRFIGDPHSRIKEDYLRILRFFRFSARFAENFDVSGLTACAAERAGLGQLSAERIGDEFSKILELPSPAGALEAMNECGILVEVWPAAADIAAFGRLKQISSGSSAALGLAALWGEQGDGVSARLRLPNTVETRRRLAVENARLILPTMTENSAKAMLYRLGVEAWRDACDLAMARGTDRAELVTIRNLPDRWKAPVFPISGKDIIAAGVPKGPLVARTLKAVEEKWIDANFPPDEQVHAMLADEIKSILKS
ncbi:MAG: CCA tRNA nucleotidyltransferase [Parvularculaceae bacterium]